MIDDFIIRALLAGVGVALLSGPLGCFVVWRRMAYFGDSMAHAALLGAACALLLNIPMTIGVFALSILGALAVLVAQRHLRLPADTLLGTLAHATLAIGLVLIAFMTWIRMDILALLFGDILAVNEYDIALIYAVAAAALIVLALFWKSMLARAVSPDIAQAENMRPDRAERVLMILLAALIAIALKIVGILLITALLIIPAAAARQFASTPERMAVIAAFIGSLAVAAGLFASLALDTPAGPSIVASALVAFLLSLAPLRRSAASL